MLVWRNCVVIIAYNVLYSFDNLVETYMYKMSGIKGVYVELCFKCLSIQRSRQSFPNLKYLKPINNMTNMNMNLNKHRTI